MQRRALEESGRLIVETEVVGRGILTDAQVAEGLGAPGTDAVVPGQIARHAGGPRRVQAQRAAVEAQGKRPAPGVSLSDFHHALLPATYPDGSRQGVPHACRSLTGGLRAVAEFRDRAD